MVLLRRKHFGQRYLLENTLKRGEEHGRAQLLLATVLVQAQNCTLQADR